MCVGMRGAYHLCLHQCVDKCCVAVFCVVCIAHQHAGGLQGAMEGSRAVSAWAGLQHRLPPQLLQRSDETLAQPQRVMPEQQAQPHHPSEQRQQTRVISMSASQPGLISVGQPSQCPVHKGFTVLT